MDFQKRYTAVVWLAALLSLSVQAADINIDGTVVASPCTVDTASVSQDVNFGRVRRADLMVAGASSEWQPFEVTLKNCPASTTSATVAFNGTPFVGDSTLYANAGTAARVAIQMAQAANKTQVQGTGSSMTVNVDAQHNATYALAGRLISPAGNTGAGSVNSVVQMNFTYQ